MLASEPNILERGSVTVDRTFLSLKGGMLCACNLLFSSIEKEFPVNFLGVDFSGS